MILLSAGAMVELFDSTQPRMPVCPMSWTCGPVLRTSGAANRFLEMREVVSQKQVLLSSFLHLTGRASVLSSLAFQV